MINSANVAFTQTWLDHFREILVTDIPKVLHSREVDGNGAPQWSPEFRAIVTGAKPSRLGKGEERYRLERALKQLRNSSAREYEVLFRVLRLSQPLHDVTAWLNERAIRGGHPERYTDRSTMVILYAAVEKVHTFY